MAQTSFAWNGVSVPVALLTSEASSIVDGPFAVSIAFTETVTGFTVDDLTVTNGTVSGFAGSGTAYTFTINPTSAGTVTVSVAAGVCVDADDNPNIQGNTLTRKYAAPGSPTCEITSSASDPVNGTFGIVITFSEVVSGFVSGDLSVTNATIDSFSTVDSVTYYADITPAAIGEITVQVPFFVCEDNDGYTNIESNVLSRDFEGDLISPTVTLSSSASDPVDRTFSVSAEFSENVTGFQLEDIAVTNGTASNLTGANASYAFDVTPATNGTVSVSLAAGVCQDAAGNGNEASNTLERTAEFITWLLADDFTTTESNPLASPRTCEPGPGTLVIYDPDSRYSISGGALQIASGTGGAGNRMVAQSSIARAVGLTFYLGFTNNVNARQQSGAHNNDHTDNNASLYSMGIAGPWYPRVDGQNIALERTAPNDSTPLQTAVVMRATGAISFFHENDYWRHGFFRASGTHDPLYPSCVPGAATGSGTVDTFRVAQLGGPLAEEYGTAELHETTTTAGQTFTGVADGQIVHTFTAEAGVDKDLIIRRTDDNNCWIVRMSMSDGTLKLIEKNAGVETERASGSHSFAAGTDYDISAWMDGSSIAVYADGQREGGYTSATFNQSATGGKVSHAGTDLLVFDLVVPTEAAEWLNMLDDAV